MGNKLGHKVLLTTILLTTALILLSSCMTMTPGSENFEFEYDYTLQLVKDQTQEQAVTEMFMALTSYRHTLIPNEYAFLETESPSIPGMGRLIQSWSTQVADFLLSNFNYLTNLSNEVLDTIEFENPQQMVETSDSSIAELYRQLYFSIIEKAIHERLHELNLENWNAMVTQYNAWVATQELLGNGSGKPISESDIASKVSKLVADLYFTYFTQKETLIRTTPNPDMDPTAARVLGLDR
ncbi:MAG: hypothetical protein MJ057_04190 [Sphaerochaetaceae bacterium]|nr:hypothetical protein [Sphaerochaetaceae bacterium]